MIPIDVIIEAFEQDGDECIGVFDGVPYFIDVSGCPFAHDVVDHYDPLSDYGRSCESVSMVQDSRIRAAAERAMHKRDTENREYIETIRSMKRGESA